MRGREVEVEVEVEIEVIIKSKGGKKMWEQRLSRALYLNTWKKKKRREEKEKEKEKKAKAHNKLHQRVFFFCFFLG